MALTLKCVKDSFHEYIVTLSCFPSDVRCVANRNIRLRLFCFLCLSFITLGIIFLSFSLLSCCYPQYKVMSKLVRRVKLMNAIKVLCFYRICILPKIFSPGSEGFHVLSWVRFNFNPFFFLFCVCRLLMVSFICWYHKQVFLQSARLKLHCLHVVIT